MQDNSSAFYKRVGALGAATALAVSGAFIASPAVAAPSAEPDATSTDAPLATATEAPASETAVDETVVTDGAEVSEEAGTLPPGLAEALLRDLGMTVEEFEAAGELGQKAADALPELQAAEGFVSVAIEDNKIVITGSGEALEALALELDATLVAPAGEVTDEAETTEAPAEEAAAEVTTEATEATAEATEAAAEAAAEEEIAAPAALPANHRQAVATLRADYIANVGVQGLQSVLWDGSSYVISVNQDAVLSDSVLAKSLAEVAGTPAHALAEKYNNVKVSFSSGTTTPLEDVVNGQGYLIDLNGACSIGFNGFNGEGAPAVISAGHCTDDSNAKEATLSDPTEDPAVGGPGFVAGSDLGTFGFSQFGGPGHTPINLETGENVGTDIAAIDNINSDLNLLPEVTEWTNAADLTETTTKITGVGEAVDGAPVCKAGRTTGWTCGEVTAAIAEFVVAGHNYPGDPDDGRGVLGFETSVPGAPGDSGGSVISGTTALGVVSAGGTRDGMDVMLATSLTDGMTRLEGYSVAVFVDAPQLTSHENKGTVLTDEAISGTTTGTSVKLTRDGETVDLDVVDGKWSFNAPSTVPEGGTLEFKVQAINGFNKSKTATYELTVKEAPLAVPAITNPADGAAIADAITTITGTGVAGAEVTVNVSGNSSAEESDTAGALAAIRETGTATVTDKGTWSLKLDEALSYGAYTVTASQDGVAGKAESPTVTSKFSVILEKAAITSITEGQDFAEGENPADISGTGTAGAKVDVTIGENTLSATVGDNGDWKVRGFPVLVPGSYTVSAVQTLEGATSAPVEVTFTVTKVVVEEAAPPVVPPAPAPDNNGDGLPDTGAAGMGLFAGAGLLLTAGGISALLINRRRQLQDA